MLTPVNAISASVFCISADKRHQRIATLNAISASVFCISADKRHQRIATLNAISASVFCISADKRHQRIATKRHQRKRFLHQRTNLYRFVLHRTIIAANCHQGNRFLHQHICTYTQAYMIYTQRIRKRISSVCIYADVGGTQVHFVYASVQNTPLDPHGRHSRSQRTNWRQGQAAASTDSSLLRAHVARTVTVLNPPPPAQTSYDSRQARGAEKLRPSKCKSKATGQEQVKVWRGGGPGRGPSHDHVYMRRYPESAQQYSWRRSVARIPCDLRP